ncbi:SRPBCC domain-containing protein [Chitinophaga sp.]|uniref:SRPBCC family protein n=1 Tax=Chitinophaga sp. TaxID=1869181 RepID=UPI002F92C758
MNTHPLVVERTMNAPVQSVWEALTDNEKLKQWYFPLTTFEATPGFEFSFKAGKEGEEYLHHCKVTAVEPLKKLAYSWRYDGYAGDSEVTWELFREGDKTRLRITHSGLDTFPLEEAFAVERFSEGWNYILGTSLKDFLAK